MKNLITFQRKLKKFTNLFKFNLFSGKKNLLFFVSTALVKVSPIITLPFLLRKSGSEKFNLLVLFELAFLFFEVILSFQNRLVISRNFFKWDSKIQLINSYLIFHRVLFYNKYLFFVSLFLLVISFKVRSDYFSIIIFALTYSILFIITQFPVTLYRIQNKSFQFIFYSLILLIIELVSFFSIISFNLEFFPTYFLIKIIGYLLLSIFVIFSMYKNHLAGNTDKNQRIDKEFNFGKSMIIYQSFNILYNNSDKLVMYVYANPVMISSYYIITKLLSPLSIFYSIIKESSTSSFYRLYANYLSNKSRIRLFNLSILISISSVAFLNIVFVPFYFEFLNEKSRLDSGLNVILIFTSFNVVHQAINLFYFPGLHFYKSIKPITSVIFKCLIFFITFFLSYNNCGVFAIAIAITTGELIFTLLSLKYSKSLFIDFESNYLDLSMIVTLFFALIGLYILF